MTVPLPEPDMSYVIDGPAKYNAQQLHAHAAAVSAADNAALQKEINTAKIIIAGQAKRLVHHARELGPLMQRAADVAGERAANASLTDEVERLRGVVEGAAAADEFLDSPEAIYRLARMARAALGETT